MTDNQKVKEWAEDEADSYEEECDGVEEALEYMVMDANSECETQLSKEELTIIIREVLES